MEVQVEVIAVTHAHHGLEVSLNDALTVLVHEGQRMDHLTLERLVGQCHAARLREHVLHLVDASEDGEQMAVWVIVHHAHTTRLQGIVDARDIFVDFLV